MLSLFQTKPIFFNRNKFLLYSISILEHSVIQNIMGFFPPLTCEIFVYHHDFSLVISDYLNIILSVFTEWKIVASRTWVLFGCRLGAFVWFCLCRVISKLPTLNAESRLLDPFVLCCCLCSCFYKNKQW